MQPAKLKTQLAHFTGSDTFTRHGLMRIMLMTEGVVFLAEAAQAHWLTDAIGSYLLDDRAKREEFQVWTLGVDITTRHATLTMADGNDTTGTGAAGRGTCQGGKTARGAGAAACGSALIARRGGILVPNLNLFAVSQLSRPPIPV